MTAERLIVPVIIAAGGTLFLLLMRVFLRKIDRTLENMQIICDAIYRYGVDQIGKGAWPPGVDFGQMESFDKALFRLWDWGYENILPKEAMEKIRPYIRDTGKERDE